MLILKTNDPMPLYKQLYNQVREQILSGKLPAGSRLPSVRDLAVHLATSRNTVDGAYQELYAEGYIYSKPRSGYFVSMFDQEAAPPSPAPKARSSQASPESPPRYAYDFHPARLAPESFPSALWRKLFTETLRESSRELMEYGDPQGEWVLRSGIREYLERSRGVVCDAEQILISAGLQHSLGIVAHLLKGRHSVVAVEDPGYHLPPAVFRNHSFEIAPVPVGSSGLDLDILKSSSATIAYVTPSHQLPMGCVMPVSNRLKLIDWGGSGGNVIIEDDYDSELRYHGNPIPSLQGLQPGGNIVYLGTFSKILSPALRVSYLVLPHSLLATYRTLFPDYFSSVSLLEQRTLAKFMEQGHWDRHIRRMRGIYRKKHDALLAAIDRSFGARAVVVGQGAGLHVIVHLCGTAVVETEIIRRARHHGIRIFPFSTTCSSGTGGPATLMLGFGGMTASEIEQAVTLLARICF